MRLHIVLAVLVSGVASSLTDWFFTGILFHKKYKAYPEVWRRPAGGPGETQAIAWSILLGFLTCASFLAACALMGLEGYAAPLKLAVLVWLIGPVPLAIGNALFMKFHPLTVVSHLLGWLAKLLIAALAAGRFLP